MWAEKRPGAPSKAAGHVLQLDLEVHSRGHIHYTEDECNLLSSQVICRFKSETKQRLEVQ